VWFLQGEGVSGEIGLFEGFVVDWVWVGVGSGWSLCTRSGTAAGCSLFTLSRTTGSPGDGSFASLLWRGIGWLLIGVVSLR
jgi:hypothetical protein